VRMPVSDPLYELQQLYFHRSRFWDPWAQSSSAAFVHFRDLPALRHLDYPDLVHIDGSDAPRVTRALLDAMQQAGVLRR